MTGLLSLCKKYFGHENLYAVLGIAKSASDQQVKKAYHKLSLKVHPDRVEESQKAEATEKFKVLGKIHSILSNKEKRAVYDETGNFDEEDYTIGDCDWLNYWKAVFRPISEKDIIDYEKKYKNSYEEAMDLKKAYLNGKGDMDLIYEFVPFTNCDEEERLKKIIQKFIDDGEVPAYDTFVNEPPKKAAKRKRKYELEAKKAAALSGSATGDPTGEETLKLLIESKQRERGEQMNKFFDSLAAKYGQPEKKKRETKTVTKKRKRALTLWISGIPCHLVTMYWHLDMVFLSGGGPSKAHPSQMPSLLNSSFFILLLVNYALLS